MAIGRKERLVSECVSLYKQ